MFTATNKGVAPRPWAPGTHTPPLSGSVVLWGAGRGLKFPLTRVGAREGRLQPSFLHFTCIPNFLYGWKLSFKDSFLPSTEGRVGQVRDPSLATQSTVAPWVRVGRVTQAGH